MQPLPLSWTVSGPGLSLCCRVLGDSFPLLLSSPFSAPRLDRWVTDSSRSVSTQESQLLSSQEDAGFGSLASCCSSILPTFLQKPHPGPEEGL